MKVLCVDDYEANALIYEKCFGCHDFDATVTLDPETFLKLAKDIKYDAYVIDLNMPVMDGIELILAIGDKTIPIAIVTADDAIDKRKLELKGYNVTVFKKPIIIKQLISYFKAL